MRARVIALDFLCLETKKEDNYEHYVFLESRFG